MGSILSKVLPGTVTVDELLQLPTRWVGGGVPIERIDSVLLQRTRTLKGTHGHVLYQAAHSLQHHRVCRRRRGLVVRLCIRALQQTNFCILGISEGVVQQHKRRVSKLVTTIFLESTRKVLEQTPKKFCISQTRRLLEKCVRTPYN